MAQNDLITVIVPVYNAHDYLRKCVDSILAQTYRNLEIMLVDDGSRDDSLAICREYAEKDGRIRVFHKENGGQWSARNLALDNANGDFIGFVDNDDWVYPEMYERLHELMVETNADIGRCDDCSAPEDKKLESNEVETDSGESYFGKIFCDILGGHVTDRLFRRETIGSSRFPKSKTIEDMRFMRLIVNNDSKEVHTKERLYYYTIRHDNTSFRYAANHINSYERAEEYQDRFYEAEKIYPCFAPPLLAKSVMAGCGTMRILLKQKMRDSEEYKKMRRFMKHNKRSILKAKNVGLKYKVFVAVLP